MKKFKNFLYYEWRKILLVGLVVTIVAVTVAECRSKVDTDLGILYISNISPGSIDSLADNIGSAKIASDADGDGRTSVITRTVLIPNDEKLSFEQQVPEQIQIELVFGDCRLFLVNEDVLNRHSADQTFADLGMIAESLGIDKALCYSYENTIYAISAEGNSLLESLGINTQNIYIAMRNYLPEKEDDVLNINAANGLKYILKNN